MKIKDSFVFIFIKKYIYIIFYFYKFPQVFAPINIFFHCPCHHFFRAYFVGDEDLSRSLDLHRQLLRPPLAGAGEQPGGGGQAGVEGAAFDPNQGGQPAAQAIEGAGSQPLATGETQGGEEVV